MDEESFTYKNYRQMGQKKKNKEREKNPRSTL